MPLVQRETTIFPAAVLSLAVLLAFGCTAERPDSRPKASEREAAPGVGQESGLPELSDPWIEVYPRTLKRNERIYQHPEVGPKLLERRGLDAALVERSSPDRAVIVRAVVSRSGRVAKAQLLRSAPWPDSSPALEEALVKALRGWRFEPAMLEGEPVAVYMNLTIPVIPELAPTRPDAP